jgi:hypothetical protein
MLNNNGEQSVLVPDRINIVGETHTENDARRADARVFCQAITGDINCFSLAPVAVAEVGPVRHLLA